VRRLLLILLLASPCWATISVSQKKCTGTTSSDACSGTTCTLSGLTAIGAGHLLIAALLEDSSGSAITISSINNETWTHCTGCAKNGTSAGVDASYVLSATGSETSLLMTISATQTGWNFCAYEYSTTTSGFSLDGAACNSLIATAAPTTCTTTSFAGTSDVILGAFGWSLSLTGVTSPGQDFIEANGNGIADKINQSAAVSIAFTPTTSGSGPDFEIAFKEAASAGPNIGFKGKVGFIGKVGIL
jgi:hypothetical protein